MSHGPVSPEGKERSSRNAMRHGLTAEKITVMDEEEADFEAYRQEFLADLQPADALEGALAERVVLLNWRLRRAAWMEAGLIRADQWEAHDRETQNETREVRGTWRPPPLSTMGRVLQESMSGPHCAYDTVGRYERRLERGLFQAIRELRELRKERRGGAVRGGGRHDSSSPPGEAPPADACLCPQAGEGMVPGMASGQAAATAQGPQDRAEVAASGFAEGYAGGAAANRGAAANHGTAANHGAAENHEAAEDHGAAENAPPVAAGGPSALQKVHPDSLKYLEEAERSANASLRKVAARVRAKLGLPPARES